MAAVTVLIWELKNIKSATTCTFPLPICHEVMGPDAMILVFWMLNFKPAFSFYSSPSSRGSLAPLHFLPLEWYHLYTWVVAISPGNLDSSLWFIQHSILHDVLCIEVKQAGWQYTILMYSFPNFEPVHCFLSGSNCCFLTCIQVSQEAGKVVWYTHLFQNFPQFVVIHTVKGFSVVNEAEVNVFLEFSLFFCDPVDVGN